MTLQLTKHIEPDCSMPQTQETGRERRQTKAERARTQVKRAKCMCQRWAFSLTPAEKPVRRLFTTNLNKVYNNPPDRITDQNMYLQSILRDNKNITGLAWCLFKCACIGPGTANLRPEDSVCGLPFMTQEGPT